MHRIVVLLVTRISRIYAVSWPCGHMCMIENSLGCMWSPMARGKFLHWSFNCYYYQRYRHENCVSSAKAWEQTDVDQNLIYKTKLYLSVWWSTYVAIQQYITTVWYVFFINFSYDIWVIPKIANTNLVNMRRILLHIFPFFLSFFRIWNVRILYWNLLKFCFAENRCPLPIKLDKKWMGSWTHKRKRKEKAKK